MTLSAERILGSSLFEIDLLTDHEPRTPGGETPPSTAGETPAATEVRFMGRFMGTVGNRPDGAEWDSPGQGPGNGIPTHSLALKGRHLVGIVSTGLGGRTVGRR